MKLKSALSLILPIVVIGGVAGAISIPYTLAQPATDGQPSPEAAANDSNPNSNQPANTGVDPELVGVDEPDNPDGVDLDPSLKAANSDGEGASKSSVNSKDIDELKNALNGKDGQKKSDGAIMPKLVGANIPVIPINLLFPTGASDVAKTSRIEEVAGTGVLMMGINRATGQVMRFRVPVGSNVTYENLSISVSACYKSLPDMPLESWAYVDVIDKGAPETKQLAVLAQRNRNKMKEAQGSHRLRKGWIIASSPTVTAIDHPIYDVTLLACEGGAAAATAATPEVKDNKDQKKG